MKPTLSTLRWDAGELQRKLKKLGVEPPPPEGQKPKPGMMKPGKFYSAGKAFAEWDAYVALLRATLEAQADAWSMQAYGHNVFAAAQEAAPVNQRLARPHDHVAARPVLDNRGYLALALLAVEHVRPLVPAATKKQFEELAAVAQRVAAGHPMSDNEAPGDMTASGHLAVALGAALEAEQTDIRNVGGKGARMACAEAVRLVKKPRAFLEALDAHIALEDARTQLEKMNARASVIAVPWRGAEKGKSSHWLLKLANGRHALVWKAKGKWRLDEGARDDMLATVSDAHMAKAIKAVLSR